MFTLRMAKEAATGLVALGVIILSVGITLSICVIAGMLFVACTRPGGYEVRDIVESGCIISGGCFICIYMALVVIKTMIKAWRETDDN